jgi:hypothetical protein
MGEEEKGKLRMVGVGMEMWMDNRGEVGSLAFAGYGDHVARKGKGSLNPVQPPHLLGAATSHQ